MFENVDELNLKKLTEKGSDFCMLAVYLQECMSIRFVRFWNCLIYPLFHGVFLAPVQKPTKLFALQPDILHSIDGQHSPLVLANEPTQYP